MPLRFPSLDRYPDFLDLIADFDGGSLDGSGFWGDHRPVLTPEGYRAWVATLLAEGNTEIELPAGRVHCSYFWITDADDAWVGFLALRHTLNDFLFEQGGHIGYSVRPSRRREGHAHSALREALTRAADLGLDRALITCDDDNVASARTIESCGGVWEDTRSDKRRYWAATTPSDR
ncbi:GNAT family N-acetyltransferase [Nocardioides sp. Bht2]|uniref:GNAT family N-acetyltransferase n=1 Tax=Nocardioides sp. Bht2 TaxID=3392297 RepID=UPI0039B43AB7